MVVAAGQDVMNVLKVGLKDHSDDLGVRNQRWGFATNDQRSYKTPVFIRIPRWRYAVVVLACGIGAHLLLVLLVVVVTLVLSLSA